MVKDSEAAGIPKIDELGRVVHINAIRHPILATSPFLKKATI